MRARVTEEGVIIPPKLLKGVTEVEIRKENGMVLVVPRKGDDPIYKLGSKPVPCGTPNASVKLDDYVYAVPR
jgi:hypothetical protein